MSRNLSERFSKHFIAACALVTFMALAGCGSEDGWVRQPPPAALLRVVNTIADSPGFTVDYENQRIGFVNFSESSAFTQVLPDVTRTLKVSFIRDGQLVALIAQDIKIDIDHLTTAIIVGTMAEPQLLFVNDLPVDFPEGNTVSELRFVHAASSLPSPTDFHLTELESPSGAPLTSLPQNTISELIEFETITEAKLQTFTNGQADPFWDSGSFPVPASSRPLFILVDYFGPGGTEARVISVSAVGTSTFPNESLEVVKRLANMISDVTSVDVYLDELLVGEDLLFGDVTGFDQIEPGTYAVKVTTANSIEDILSEATYTAIQGEYQTIVATGIGGVGTSSTTIDSFRRVTDRAILAITNTSPAAGSVDVYVMLSGQSVNDNFPGITGLSSPGHANLLLINGTYDIVLTETGTKTMVFGPERLTFESRGLYRIYATDSTGGGEPVSIVLGDDFNPAFSP